MEKQIFVVATNNKGKLRELGEILEMNGFGCISLAEAGIESDPDEEGETFLENALLKAREAADKTDLPVIADDSGLMVDALDGAPGIFTGRYAGEHATADQNIDKLLSELEGVPLEKRGAKFCCTVAAIVDGKEITAYGECRGYIGTERLGTGGFGYKPVFYLAEGVTMATVTEEEINRISHRGVAMKELCKKLREFYDNK